MKQHKIFFPPSIICTNCSEKGHQSKQCQQPITSYGAILFRIQDNWKQAEALLQGNLTGLEEVHSKIEFLLIHSVDDYWYFLDVFLSPNIRQCVARHSVVAYFSDIRVDGAKYASLGCSLNGVDSVLAHGSCFLSRRIQSTSRI